MTRKGRLPAVQSLVSAGARDRLARAEEPVVGRLCAGGRWIRTIGPRKGRFLLRKANCGTERGQPKRVVSYTVPMVRIHLPPAVSLRTTGSSARASRSRAPALTSDCRAAAYNTAEVMGTSGFTRPPTSLRVAYLLVRRSTAIRYTRAFALPRRMRTSFHHSSRAARAAG